MSQVKRSRKVVDDLVASDEGKVIFSCCVQKNFFLILCIVTYGVTTGFGKFASIVISKEKTV